jgi:DNA-binding LytR/AlgR family response regulator
VNAPNYDADHFRASAPDVLSVPGPLSVPAPLSIPALPIPDAPLPPLRILVVEDEGLIALNLELILQRFGCEIVGPISDVDGIVGAARTHRPDGAFLDVNLRGRKVFDVLPEMMGLGIPCVLSSGYDDPMLFPAPFRNMPRIAKPFDETALRRACAEFGSLAEARQAGPGGEALAFPRRRRFPALAHEIEEEDALRAVAGLR